MPSAVNPNPRAAPPDDMDDLFNYDATLDPSSSNEAREQHQQNPDGISAGLVQPSLNMDEEIKVTRKRQPVAKLDEERFISLRLITWRESDIGKLDCCLGTAFPSCARYQRRSSSRERVMRCANLLSTSAKG